MHKICKAKNFQDFFWPLSVMQSKRHNRYAYMTYSMLKGLQCIIGRFQTRFFKGKQKDRLLSFLILNVIEAKIFHHIFLEGHNV